MYACVIIVSAENIHTVCLTFCLSNSQSYRRLLIIFCHNFIFIYSSMERKRKSKTGVILQVLVCSNQTPSAYITHTCIIYEDLYSNCACRFHCIQFQILKEYHISVKSDRSVWHKAGLAVSKLGAAWWLTRLVGFRCVVNFTHATIS